MEKGFIFLSTILQARRCLFSLSWWLKISNQLGSIQWRWLFPVMTLQERLATSVQFVPLTIFLRWWCFQVMPVLSFVVFPMNPWDAFLVSLKLGTTKNGKLDLQQKWKSGRKSSRWYWGEFNFCQVWNKIVSKSILNIYLFIFQKVFFQFLYYFQTTIYNITWILSHRRY